MAREATKACHAIEEVAQEATEAHHVAKASIDTAIVGRITVEGEAWDLWIAVAAAQQERRDARAVEDALCIEHQGLAVRTTKKAQSIKKALGGPLGPGPTIAL